VEFGNPAVLKSYEESSVASRRMRGSVVFHPHLSVGLDFRLTLWAIYTTVGLFSIGRSRRLDRHRPIADLTSDGLFLRGKAALRIYTSCAFNGNGVARHQSVSWKDLYI